MNIILVILWIAGLICLWIPEVDNATVLTIWAYPVSYLGGISLGKLIKGECG